MSAMERTAGDGQVQQLQQEEPRRGELRKELPTRDYAALVALFNGLMATGLLAAKCSREPLPERIDPKDLLLFALSTQKLSRLITKEKVTTALRAPFTEIQGKGRSEERRVGKGCRTRRRRDTAQ